MNIGLRIKEQRILFEMTQQDLADKLELSFDMVRSLEQGRKKPSIETLVKIADLFNVSTDYLLDRERVEIGPEKQILQLEKLLEIADKIKEFDKNRKLAPFDLLDTYADYIHANHIDFNTKLFLKDRTAHAEYIIKACNDEIKKLKDTP